MLLASAFGLSMAFAATQASATVFQGTFGVTANTDDGLIINSAPNVQSGFGSGNSIHFDLTNVHDTVTFKLFDIWTPETAENFDDLVPQPITVNFDFVLPPPAFGGSADGSTVSGLFGGGIVDWDNPSFIHFGELGDGVLKVTLEDEFFNPGLFGYNGGQALGANVKVTFELKHQATEVPEPGTLAVLGLGLVGLAAVRRRKAA
jgi:hypothetical protein